MFDQLQTKIKEKVEGYISENLLIGAVVLIVLFALSSLNITDDKIKKIGNKK